jgi:hypothetical protein
MKSMAINSPLAAVFNHVTADVSELSFSKANWEFKNQLNAAHMPVGSHDKKI